MNKFHKLALLTLLVTLSSLANSGTVGVQVGRIVEVLTYADFGDGDVAIYTQNQGAGCDGFWFRTTQKNGKEIYAQLMMAQQAQQSMSFIVYDDQIWNGSASRFCRIYAISTRGS